MALLRSAEPRERTRMRTRTDLLVLASVGVSALMRDALEKLALGSARSQRPRNSVSMPCSIEHLPCC